MILPSESLVVKRSKGIPRSVESPFTDGPCPKSKQQQINEVMMSSRSGNK
jgi:hypothetical protein